PDEPSGYPDDPAAPPPPLDMTGAEPVGPAPRGTRLPVPAGSIEAAKQATRSRARDVGLLLVRYARRYWPERAPRPVASTDEPPRFVGRLGQVLPYLRAIPWLLGALFALSFAWDFDGVTVRLLGEAVSAEGLLRVTAVSGLIGFLTNWLAITMLFQPREKRAILPQGLIPAQRERVIYRLAQAISQELINEEIIKEKIHESGVIGRYRDLALTTVRGVVEDPGFRAELKALAGDYAQEVLGSEPVRKELAQLAAQKVEEQAGQGFGGVALRLYRTFAEDDFQRRIDRAIAELPQAITPLLDRLDAALDAVPARVEARADDLEAWATRAVLSAIESFDVRSLIVENARKYDEAQLERILKSTSNEQLNYIKYLGGILGTFGGLVIWQPLLALAAFAALGLGVWALDEALVRARRARA
ncbi:MAG: DUF445 family protein, partial [Rubricoccaceae bacterium]|nr:DUF445 family protein [Rubricoccaceae bacterium]